MDERTDRGLAYEKSGDNQRALADYSQAIHLDPNFFEPLITRGRLYAEAGNFSDAIKDITESLRLGPGIAPQFYARAFSYARDKRFRSNLVFLIVVEFAAGSHTEIVNDVSVLVTGRYMVSRSTGSRPASRIRRSSSLRTMPCGVVAPAS